MKSLDGHPLPQETTDRSHAGRSEAAATDADAPDQQHLQGYYLHYDTTDARDHCCTNRPTADAAWTSVVDALALSSDLSGALFFRIIGLYGTRRIGNAIDRPLPPRRRGVDVQYDLPPGGLVAIRLLTYRSRDIDDPGPWRLKITANDEGISGTSPETLLVDSRYDEQRVLLACKRVLDNTISPVVIGVDSPAEGRPETELSLVTRIATPWATLALLFTFLASGTLFLSIGPDFIEKVTGKGEWLHESRSSVAVGCKVIGALIAAFGAYLGFRKLPLRG